MTCELTEETGPAPEAGATGCATSHAEGAVAWSTIQFCNGATDWLLYCNNDVWTASMGNARDDFSASQKWAIVPGNSPDSWKAGSHTASAILNARCAATDEFRNAGGVYICVEALKSGQFVAAICQQGTVTETPLCATDFSMTQLNGGSIAVDSADCPSQEITA